LFNFINTNKKTLKPQRVLVINTLQPNYYGSLIWLVPLLNC